MKPDGALDHLLGDLGRGLDWLDTEIKKPDFVKNVENFMGGLGSLVVSLGSVAAKLGSFAIWLGIDTANASTNPTGASGAGPGGGGTAGGGSTGGGWGAHRGSVNDTTGPMRDRGGSPHGGGGGATPGSGGGGRTGASGLGANAGDGASGGLRLMNRLVANGWTPEAAAIAAGNADVESGIQTNPRGSNDHGTSAGMMQWHNDRKVKMEAYVRSHVGMSEFDAQSDYVNEDPRWNRFKHVNSLDDAGHISHSAEGYSTNTTGARVAKSQQWLSTYKNQKVTVQNEPGGNNNSAANAAAAGSP
jgi:Phage tail lysozyme